MSNWVNSTVLVTGACGTVGSRLLERLIAIGVGHVVGVDNDEEKIFKAKMAWTAEPKISIRYGDIRDRNRIFGLMKGVDVVLHLAAMKHVIICEESAYDAVETNIVGTQNLIDAALMAEVKRFIFTSSDKAVNPSNGMGTSKLMAEKLVSAAHCAQSGEVDVVFASTRFGNVLGSSGSVLPVFKHQITNGQNVTLTDERMTRFVMSIDQAVDLVIASTWLARGGEVFVTKMPSIRIKDLAEILIDRASEQGGAKPKIIETGPRVGEKLYEELVSEHEMGSAIDTAEFHVVSPQSEATYKTDTKAFQGFGVASLGHIRSSVDISLTKEQLKSFLVQSELV